MQYFTDFTALLSGESLTFLLIGFLVLLGVSYRFLTAVGSDRFYFKCLFLVGFVLFGIGFSLIDPFLNEWDEQYHALVAKNLSENPFQPVLIKNSPVALDYKTWTYCHVWMHKQPLFLWQMALSVKTFGPTLFAVRFPSVLLHACTAVLVLSIARRCLSKPLALLACLLFGLSGYFNDYTSGAIGMDHNDVAFVFYITLSCWCWLKYRENRRSVKWQVLIGLAAGAAVLCKWLVGLLVFSGWGLILLVEHAGNWQEWKALLRSFAVTCFVVAPWQLYSYVRFNREYVHEMRYNNRHLFHAVEAHKQDGLFYWQTMKQAFGGGELIRWLVLLGGVLWVIHAIRTREKWKLFFPFVFLIAFTFFTIAQTKLQGYITIVAPIGFLFLLFPVHQLVRHTRLSGVQLPAYAIILLFVPVLYLQFGFKQVLDQHKFGAPEVREERFRQTQKARTFMAQHPQANGGYYLLKDQSANILCSVLFFTDNNVLEYSDALVDRLRQQGISYRIIQY